MSLVFFLKQEIILNLIKKRVTHLFFQRFVYHKTIDIIPFLFLFWLKKTLQLNC